MGGGTCHGQSIGSLENAKAVYFLSSAGPAVILACLGVGLKMSHYTSSGRWETN